MIDEIWKPVKDWENYYEISNYGRLKRLPRMSKHSFGNFYKPYGEKIIKRTMRNKKRYINVHLTKNGICVTKQLHRLVLLTFVPMPEDKPYVNHINGDKHDNRLINLEWVSAKENCRHAIDTGLTVFLQGEDVANSKITKKQAIKIKKLLKQKVRNCDIAVKLKTTQKIVADIKSGRTWSHLDIGDNR